MTKSIRKSVGYIALAGLVLGGCTSLTADIKSSDTGPRPKGEDGNLARFPDIPIPRQATMNVERSLILGPRDSWLGRLVFTTNANTQQVFEFYSREMPGFGWQEVTRARAKISILTYTRGGRAATIQIATTTLGGAEVNFTISPSAGAGAVGPAGTPRQ